MPDNNSNSAVIQVPEESRVEWSATHYMYAGSVIFNWSELRRTSVATYVNIDVINSCLTADVCIISRDLLWRVFVVKQRLQDAGVSAFLIGEALVRDPQGALTRLFKGE